jgi:hypothetical protein
MFNLTHIVVCKGSDKHDVGICMEHVVASIHHRDFSSIMYIIHVHVPITWNFAFRMKVVHNNRLTHSSTHFNFFKSS